MRDSYWGRKLTPIPPSPIVMKDLEYIEHVGFIGQPNQCAKHLKGSKPKDVKMVEELSQRGIPFDPNAFEVMKPTHEGAFNATRRYDKDPNIRLPEDVMELAAAQLLDYYREFAETCPVCPEEQMSWNRKSSPGHYFKTEYGFKDTGEVLDSSVGMDEMRGFCHAPVFPTLWTVAVKEEMLPAKKIKENVPRTFIIPDKRLHYLCLYMFGKQHDLFVSLSQRLDSHHTGGYNFFSGGFSRLMDLLAYFEIIFEGDCAKYDSSLRYLLFEKFVIPVRTLLFKPTAPTWSGRRREKSWFNETIWEVYYDMIFAYARLPNAQVIRFFLGMKSGFFGTSDDNTLIHKGVNNALWIMAKKMYDAEIEALTKLFADDHIGGVNTNKPECVSYEFRKKIYNSFGLELKAEADMVSGSPEGHTFLGFRCTWSSEYHHWVPVFNVERLCCMLCTDRGQVPRHIIFARINACRLLAFFTPYRDHFRQLAIDFYDQVYVKSDPYPAGSIESLEYQSLCSLWTDEEVEALWFAYESRGVGPNNSTVENDKDKNRKSKSSRCESRGATFKILSYSTAQAYAEGNSQEDEECQEGWC